MKEVLIVDVGQTISVGGDHFVITEMRRELGKPSKLITKQPVELVTDREVWFDAARSKRTQGIG